MARDLRVRATLEGRDEASRPIGRAQGAFERLRSFLTLRFVASVAAVGFALRGVAGLFNTLTSAAARQELAVTKLNAALRPLGPRAIEVSRALQEQASALQRVTRFGDETIIEGQALIASFNRNQQVIEAGTRAALDLAAATGTDLRAAFQLLGRAAAGETSTLSRYGIILDEGIPKSERFAAAVEKINEQFGGQAQAQAATYAGRLDQISNNFGDLLEQTGAVVTESSTFADLLGRINFGLEVLKGTLPATSTGLSDLERAQRRVARAETELAEAESRLSREQENSGLLLSRLAGLFQTNEQRSRQVFFAKQAVARAERELAEATAAVNEEIEKQNNAVEDNTDSLNKLRARIRELGVETEAEFAEKLAAANETLRLARENASELGLTLDDLAVIEAKIAELQEKRAETARELTLAQQLLAEANNEVAASLQGIAERSTVAASAQRALSTETRRTREEALTTSRVLSGTFPGTIEELRSLLRTFGFTGSFGRFSRTPLSFSSGHVEQMRLSHPEDF